jgi:hypothetical protein
MKHLLLICSLFASTLGYAQSYSGGTPLPGLPKSLGPKTMAASTSVTFATDQVPITVNATTTPGGKTSVEQARIDYTITPVTSVAYTQLIAATSGPATEIEIFDSSGRTLKLAFGAPGSEVDQLYIFPGGNGKVPLEVPIGTRLSIEAVSVSATAGEIDVNLYN